jgi:hypothetical protein
LLHFEKSGLRGRIDPRFDSKRFRTRFVEITKRFFDLESHSENISKTFVAEILFFP